LQSLKQFMVVNMRTLTLEEAAALLKMTPEGLRIKASKGEVPGAKPGKRWVFKEDDLDQYLQSLYSKLAKESQGVIKVSRRKSWHSTSEKISGGLMSTTMEKEYNNLLGLVTK
jgi:excisionase family DNA binding protein